MDGVILGSGLGWRQNPDTHQADLFAALAGYQFQAVTAGLAPASAEDLADAVGTVYQRSVPGRRHRAGRR